MVETELIDTDDGLLAGIDVGLRAGSRLFDLEFGKTGLDGLGHTAEFSRFPGYVPMRGERSRW